MCHRILVRCHEIKKIDNCRIKLREEIIVLQLITEVVFITFYFFTINCHMLWTSCFLNILFSFREREEKGEKYHVREKEWPLISYLSRPSPRPPCGRTLKAGLCPPWNWAGSPSPCRLASSQVGHTGQGCFQPLFLQMSSWPLSFYWNWVSSFIYICFFHCFKMH